jgi:hypothetical protein
MLLGDGAGGPALLFIELATPERRNSGIVGTGGGVAEAIAPEPTDDDTPTLAPALALLEPAAALLAPAANPLAPAKAAPVAIAPARTNANAVDPTSPEITFLAMNGTSAIASA